MNKYASLKTYATYLSIYLSIYLHYISFHFITLPYISLHYITFNFITLHYVSLHYITLRFITLHYIAFHFITLHFITFHYISLHYITFHYITFHYISLHYISSHHITLHNKRKYIYTIHVGALQAQHGFLGCPAWQRHLVAHQRQGHRPVGRSFQGADGGAQTSGWVVSGIFWVAS